MVRGEAGEVGMGGGVVAENDCIFCYNEAQLVLK